MVCMQSSVDVGAGAGTGEGVLDVEEDNIPSASTSATSLITPRTERFSRRRVSGIRIPRTLVRTSICLCLLQLRKWSEQRSGDFGIARLPGCRCAQYSMSRVSAI